MTLLEKIVSKIIQYSDDCFCQNFNGNIVCSDSKKLMENLKEVLILDGTHRINKLYDADIAELFSGLNLAFVDYVNEKLSLIEHSTTWLGRNKIRKKLSLLDLIAKDGLEIITKNE